MKQVESTTEDYLRGQVKLYGGMAIKLLAGSLTGLPDRLILLPGGILFFVELKSEGKKPRKKQLSIHKRLRALGFIVLVIDKKEQVDELFMSV